MKNICPHCTLENNNNYYCRGCGRTLKKYNTAVTTTENLPDINFLHVSVEAIDKIFPKGNDYSSVALKHAGIDMTSFAKSEGMTVIDNTRWRNVSEGANFKAFMLDILLTIFPSLLITLFSYYSLHSSIIITIKIYLVSYFLVSFINWFLFPFVFESSPCAFMFFGYGIIKGAVKRIRNDVITFFQLWILSALYLFIPILLVEYIIYLISKKPFKPLIFQLIGLKYMQMA